MKKFFSSLFGFLRKTDLLLLLLCVLATAYGIVLISSATLHEGTTTYVTTQCKALGIGIVLYFLFSAVDIDILAEKWRFLLIFSVALISLLFVVGIAGDTGNRAWIRFGGTGIQPAEIAKIPFIIILAKQIFDFRSAHKLNRFSSVFALLLLFLLFFGLILKASEDMGSALVYFFIFLIVLFIAGLKPYWFLIGLGGIAAIIPLVWNHLLSENQQQRILAPYDSSIDPSGLGITWQITKCRAAIIHGGFSGVGLYKGTYTQSGMVSQQHTDLIFSVAGEELGFIGCITILILLLAIIIRCFYVGYRSNSLLGMLVCTGMASMLIFQTLENVGMCLGLTPVIGLTLPFFSYGGSSLVTLYAAMGIVSGIKMRPNPSRFVRL